MGEPLAEKLRYWREEGCLHVSPRAMPNRSATNHARPKRTPSTWENGIARDSRGMPLLDGKGHEITVKQYAERRHEIEAMRHRLANDPNVFTKER